MFKHYRCFNKINNFMAIAIAISFMSLSTAAQAENQSPEMIVFNAKVTTQNQAQPNAEAVAIRDGLFFKVGSNKEILALKGSQTKVIDAKKRRMIPGLNDSHSHVVRGGRFYNLELRWEGVPTLKQALSMLSEQAKRTPKGQWVRVIGGWSPYQFAERRMPTLEEINSAAPDTPVFILHLYSQAFLNKAGLRELGITADTPAPTGGRYEIGADGQPTGLLLAEPNPTILYKTIGRLPQLSAIEQVNSSRQFYRELNSLGLTSAVDAGGGGHNFPENYEGSKELAELGEIPMRISYFLFPQKPGHEIDDFKRWMTLTVPGLDEHTAHAHGYEMEGGGEFLVWSAGDFENFLAPRPVQAKKMEGELEKVTKLLIKNRWPFRIHATYNESIERILNVFEKINRETPFDGLRWALDHAETISPENIARIKKLGGGIAIQSRIAFAGEDFIARYGKAAAKNAPPVREMLRQGIPVAAGTDGTRVSSYNPWVGLYWLVSGKTVGDSQLYDKDNRLSRNEALRLYTIGSAWLTNEERDKGRIAPGQYADFAILTEDYFTTKEENIKQIEALLTVVNGKVVYGAGTYKSLSPALPTAIPAWSPVNKFGGSWRSKREAH